MRPQRLRSALVLALPCALVPSAAAQSRHVGFSIDWHGPTIGTLDSASGSPITEGDILGPAGGAAGFGPLPAPDLVVSGGVAPAPGLGLPLHPACVGHAAGTPCAVEVDALSYGTDLRLVPGLTPRNLLLFSADEYALGLGLPSAPSIASEAPVGDLSADLLVDLGLLPGPLPPFAAAVPGSTGVVDGDGLPSGSGFAYRGLGLVEPNVPSTALPNSGDNVDAVLLGTLPPPPFPPTGVFLSLDSAFFDALAGAANSGSAAAHGFVGGDVLWSVAPGGPPGPFAAAAQLGLDFFGPDTDDLDALILAENFDGTYTPSLVPYDWSGGATDMLLFSVRRGSAVIGMPDSIFGLPIEEGDILTTPLAPAAGGLSPFPGIFFAAENLGLATLRAGAPRSDDLDAAELMNGPLFDCNGNGVEDAVDIAFATSLDANSNGIPDECEPGTTAYCFCPPTLAPCGNPDPTAGCRNSTGQGGLLSASGTTSVGADNLVLAATQLPAFQFGVLFMGPTNVAPVPFVDGLRCVAPPIYRYALQTSGAGGVMTYGPGLVAYTVGNFPPAGWITPGSTWHFQVWYRDPFGPCAQGSNVTNAIQALFGP